MKFVDRALEILGNIGNNTQNLCLLEPHIDQLVPFVGAGLSADFSYPTWSNLLTDLADRAGLRAEVDVLLARNQFEEAAEAIILDFRNTFDDTLRLTFDHTQLPRPLGKGAVRHLPQLARGPVLTTNFDRVLEAVFEDGGQRFSEVFPGSRIHEASRAIQLHERFLLKLHGDYLDSATRVLTLGEYEREYGNPDPRSIDFNLPLPRVLGQACGSRPLLFLGCSLRSDRTTLVIAEIARKLAGIIHFALLPGSENTRERCAQLDSWNIRPLFFPAGKYDKIDQFLEALGRAAGSATRPVGPTRETRDRTVVREEFSADVKRTVAARAGYKCSNCHAQTSGPDSAEGSVNVGVAAHITAASPGGPRYDASLSAEERSGTSNVIWLCQNDGHLVDVDASEFTVEKLRNTKAKHEARVRWELGRPQTGAADIRTLFGVQEWLRVIEEKLDHALAVKGAPNLPLFTVVDQKYLEAQSHLRKREFVIEQPAWTHVVHGSDKEIKFLERAQTEEIYSIVLRDLIAPLKQADEDLRALFLVGAPGSGKSTLVRRLAALLVQRGQATIAELEPGATDPSGRLLEHSNRLRELAASAELPLILVLDDPLYEDSGWIHLMKQLGRSRIPLGVLAATPTFLFDTYASSLQGILAVHSVSLAQPTSQELEGLAELYDREAWSSSSPTDFLVAKIEAAANQSFEEIINRLWRTVNGGHAVGASRFSGLPDELRALLAVCFFHRRGLRCPGLLLDKIVELSGRDGQRESFSARMQQHQGWSVFRIAPPERRTPDYAGLLVETAHQRIATEAWELRPVRSYSLPDLIVNASLKAPEAVRSVAELAALESPTDSRLLVALLHAWSDPATVKEIKTRNLADLSSVLSARGHWAEATLLRPVLLSRVEGVSDGWLAALMLWFLSAEDERDRGYPEAVRLGRLISTGDFTIAPSRALKLAKTVPNHLRSQFMKRLIDDVAEPGSPKVHRYLLTWLLSAAPLEQLEPIRPAIQRWMEENPSASDVTTQYLDLLVTKTDRQFQSRKEDAALWIWRTFQTSEDAWVTDVITKYLLFLSHVVQGQTEPVDEPRASDLAALYTNVVSAVNNQLIRQPDVSHVRTQFLDFVLNLSSHPISERIRRSGVDLDQVLRDLLATTLIRLQEGRDSPDVGSKLLNTATKAATPDVLVEVVRWASDYLDQTRRPWNKRDQAVCDAFHRADGPYDRLVWEYSNTSNPEEAKYVLTRAKRIMESWLSVWSDNRVNPKNLYRRRLPTP